MLVTAFAGAPFLPASFISAHAADRPVTPEEMRQIADTLQREGFTRWGKVAFDDGRFEVDDAVGADGQKYELKLSNLDFSIIARKLDD
ncbi:MAG: PepSY domain-containing protein [Phreatobacter sp.]|nr:PepSY domain-containing protein [Phreatobacter sp.]